MPENTCQPQPDIPFEVLVIDDDPVILALLKNRLCSENNFIVTATTENLDRCDWVVPEQGPIFYLENRETNLPLGRL